jgi:hypothetical protein
MHSSDRLTPDLLRRGDAGEKASSISKSEVHPAPSRDGTGETGIQDCGSIRMDANEVVERATATKRTEQVVSGDDAHVDGTKQSISALRSSVVRR